MKKIKLLSAVLAVSCTCTLLLGITLGVTRALRSFSPVAVPSPDTDSTQMLAAVQAAQPAPADSEQPLLPRSADLPEGPYLLQIAVDKLTVSVRGCAVPFAEYAISADWLPASDRLMLEYGIEVENSTQLRQILEDYIS